MPQHPLAPARSFSTSSNTSQVQGYTVDASPITPISTVPTVSVGTADEAAIINRGPDITSLKEFFDAMNGVIGDLERMWKGYTEGRGGAREAGVQNLASLLNAVCGSISNDSLRSWNQASRASPNYSSICPKRDQVEHSTQTNCFKVDLQHLPTSSPRSRLSFPLPRSWTSSLRRTCPPRGLTL